MPKLTQAELERHLWGAADILRGTVDSGDYKQYIFGLLFYKRLCDVWDEEFEALLAETGDREESFDLGGDMEAQLGATFRYQSHMVTSYPMSPVSPYARIPGYTTVDLRAGLSFDHYQVQLRAENIFDEAGIINYYPGAAGFPGLYPNAPSVSNLIRPRSFTLAFSAKF